MVKYFIVYDGAVYGSRDTLTDAICEAAREAQTNPRRRSVKVETQTWDGERWVLNSTEDLLKASCTRGANYNHVAFR
jgi:hypothetical protein